MEEEWRPIEGYENYMVSNLGRVKSIRYRHIEREKIRVLSKRKDGYMSVGLSKNGRCIPKTVHRLVAKAFIENPNNYEMVNHKDEDRSNNEVSNLEWCSRSYNQTYSMELHPERKKVFGDNFKKNGVGTSSFVVKGVAHKHHEPINQLTKDGVFVKRYESSAQAAKELELNSSSVAANIYTAAKRNRDGTKIRKRKNKRTAYGFIWEFA